MVLIENIAGSGVIDTEDTQNWAMLQEKTKTYITGEKKSIVSKVQASHWDLAFRL